MRKRHFLLVYVILFALVLGACSSGAPQYTGGASSSAGAAPPIRVSEEAAAANEEPAALPELAAAPDAEADDYDGDRPNPTTGGGGGDAFICRSTIEPPEAGGSESYLAIAENGFVSTGDESMLTFSLKVDTASYNNVERYLLSGNLPPADAVRTEELVNYFSYEERLLPQGNHPFGIYAELGASPFREGNKLAFVRVRSRDIDKASLPSSNLTFLIDTSGSMNSYDKLPLLKEAFSLLVETLGENDRVSIVTYAGSSEVVLDSASGADKNKILGAIEGLAAGGSTAGANGIHTAYTLAEKNFLKDGNNRVILATDGDFNVGISSNEELEAFIGSKRDSGVYLSILGFGTGNIRDDLMETLSKHGNGNYAYISSVDAAKKVLVDEIAANLFAIAGDVKAQVEFNPANVAGYRLIGYENRALENRDFRDDAKDAGEIGVGTDVVLLFEVELKDGASPGTFADELFEVRIRYKNPGEEAAAEMTYPVGRDRVLAVNSSDFRFASSVACFGHLLRGSEHTGKAEITGVIRLAKESLGRDEGGYRKSYLDLLLRYQRIAG